MTTPSTLDFNGLFKQAYADNLADLVPEQAVLVKAVPFKKAAAILGAQYNQPVILRREQGFTYAGQNAGAFNLNPAISMQTQNAVVPGWQLVERSAIDYETFEKSDNKNSFRNAVDLVMENAMESFNYRLETGLLYGASPTGLGSWTVAPTSPTATTAVITFTAAQWSVGIWAESEGAPLDVYTTGNALVNTIGPVTVSAVNVAGKSITVTGNATDITAVAATAAGYVVFYGSYGNIAYGIDYILSTSGSVFGIDNTTYNLWKANVVTGVTKSLAGLLSTVAVAQGRGLNEDVDILVDPVSWNAILSDQAALRLYDSSYSPAKLENGAKAITFHSQNGMLTLRSHTYVKAGEFFVLPLDRLVRVGATDTTFNIPGTMDGKVFQQIPNQAGFEFRVYSNQAMLIETPAKCVKGFWA